MTSRLDRLGPRPHQARRASDRRTLPALVALLVAATALPGCSLKLAGRRTALPAGEKRSEAKGEATPKPTAFEQRLVDSEQQAALAPAQPYWPYRIAQICLEADSSARAEAALQASLARDPGYAPSLSLLSKLYYEGGRHADAIEMLEAARSAPGGFPPELAAGLALHYDAIGHVDKARAVMASIPRSGLRAAASAMVYVTLHGAHPDSAASTAAAALEDDPKSAANYNNLGITRLRAGDPVAARQAFMRAIDIDPKRPGPYYNLAILEKYYLFDDARAARWFSSYWDRSRSDPDSLYGVFRSGDPRKLAGKEEK